MNIELSVFINVICFKVGISITKVSAFYEFMSLGLSRYWPIIMNIINKRLIKRNRAKGDGF